MRKLISLLLVGLLTIASTGCNAKTENKQIAATTLPVYEFTSFLCQGTDIAVSCLITDSISCLHDYALQVKQMRTIEEAELLVISGAGLEDFLEDVLPETDKILDASTGIPLLCGDDAHDHEHKGHTHENDPHIWLSPENAKNMAQNIYVGLVKTYPEYSDVFSKNKVLLDQKFDALIDYAANELGSISKRELVTFHDGFSYMADSFDLTILYAIEEEAGSEASAAELIELINIINQHELSAIFTEVNGSSAAATVVANETVVKIYTLDMALSGDSYFTAIYHNIDTLKEALK